MCFNNPSTVALKLLLHAGVLGDPSRFVPIFKYFLQYYHTSRFGYLFDISTKLTAVVSSYMDPIVRLQRQVRRFMGLRRVQRKAAEVWLRVFDPTTVLYFWFNSTTGTSQWSLPFGIPNVYTPIDHAAATQFQRIVRGFLARNRVKHLAALAFSRFYDMNEDAFYWSDHKSGETTWQPTRWLRRQEIPLSAEDQVLFNAKQQIRQLQEALQKKEEEIKEVRLQRFEELEPLVLQEKVAAARGEKRSKHMDEWSAEQLAAWFTEMKMDEYIPLLHKNKVDGLLFVNLSEAEREELGIHNAFHKRKLAVILRAFQTRYARKKSHYAGDDDDLSEYTPSELSGILEHEDVINKMDNEDHDDSDVSDDDEVSGDSLNPSPARDPSSCVFDYF